MSTAYITPEMLSKVAEVQNHFNLKLTIGENALNLLDDSKFLSSWDSLYNACPWGTVFQSKEFIAHWYRIYSLDCLPIIISAELQGRLVGLLTLTKVKLSKGIMFAGLGAAEYQTWLSIPSMGEVFINEALIILQRKFPGDDILFNNIPPGTPLSWVRINEKWQRRSILKPLDRPLMDLSNPDVSKIFRKKQFREKTNRLKRLGNMVFEKITGTDRFSSVIDELIMQSEFRKGAKFNFFQFGKDRRGKEFLIKLFSEGIIHATILWLDGKIIASIAAPIGKQWVHLAGLNTHSPIYARYSPGLINFIMLGQLLTEEGMHTFDLTPGGDVYKERLATSKDQVHTLHISSAFHTTVKKAIVGPVIDILKTKLNENGITPKKIKFEAIKFKERLIHGIKSRLPMPTWHYLRNGTPSHFGLCPMSISLQPESSKVQVNHIASLLSYQAGDGIHTRWDFLSDAMLRFEAGERAYTIYNKGNLLFCAWLGKHLVDEAVTNGLTSPDELLLEITYCSEPVLLQLHQLVSAITATATRNEYKKPKVCCLVDSRDKTLIDKLNPSMLVEAKYFKNVIK